MLELLQQGIIPYKTSNPQAEDKFWIDKAAGHLNNAMVGRPNFNAKVEESNIAFAEGQSQLYLWIADKQSIKDEDPVLHKKTFLGIYSESVNIAVDFGEEFSIQGNEAQYYENAFSNEKTLQGVESTFKKQVAALTKTYRDSGTEIPKLAASFADLLRDQKLLLD